MILAQAQLTRHEKQNKQVLLFGGSGGETKAASITVPSCEEWNMLEKLQKEFDALGFYLSAHPLDMYRDALANLGLTKSQNLLGKASSAQTNVNLAGIILSKQERTSKTGQKFAFVSLSDADGIYEVAFFSEAYAQIRDKLVPGKAVFISASLRADGEGYRLTGQGMEYLDQKTQNQNVFLWADETLDIKALKNILVNCSKGSAAVHLGIANSGLPRLRMILPERYEITADHRSRLMSVSGIKNH
jgi:DNA polymerase-3 subunit alpha